MRLLLSLCAALLLTACGSVPRELAATWSLEAFAFEPAPAVPTGSTRPTVTFAPAESASDAATISGFGGVNRFSGQYRAKGSQIAVGSLAATRMAGPTALMNVERLFLGIVQTATGFKVDSDKLTLESDTGSVTLTRVESAAPGEDSDGAKPDGK